MQVSLQGTREYNVGDGPDIAAQAAAQQMGIELPRDFQARQINPERDIVQFDIVLVMDKFTAADVLREVRLAAAGQHLCISACQETLRVLHAANVPALAPCGNQICCVVVADK